MAQADPDPRALLDLAVGLARDAGTLLVDGLAQARTSVETKSSGTDMVSEMDRSSEALITAGLARARPHDAVLGEEGAARPGTTGLRWLIDPLDGTTNYLYGLAAFAVSVAAERDGAPLLGVVHDPSHGETFTALLGQGSWLNGARLRRAPAPTLDRALVATGFSYGASERAAQGHLVASILPAVRDIRRVGSAALDLCCVAAGRLDGYYEAGTKPWDRAAGALVATEAGAWVGDLDGGPPTDAMTVAAAPGLTGPLLALLHRGLADQAAT